MNWSCSCQSIPQLQQHRVQAASVTYTTDHGNTGSLTHGVRPGIEPVSLWIPVGFVTAEPRWELTGEGLFFSLGAGSRHMLSSCKFIQLYDFEFDNKMIKAEHVSWSRLNPSLFSVLLEVEGRCSESLVSWPPTGITRVPPQARNPQTQRLFPSSLDNAQSSGVNCQGKSHHHSLGPRSRALRGYRLSPSATSCQL